jgi:PAS domain-containing protein
MTVGIPASLLPRIFDPFVTSRMGSGGTGLGLHIAHNIAANVLGGRISATSSEGRGTTFEIEIPCLHRNRSRRRAAVTARRQAFTACHEPRRVAPGHPACRWLRVSTNGRIPAASQELRHVATTLHQAPKQTWLWLAPYFAIGVFALAMLVLTALLQWRELDTARSALEGDMHWAERTIESRLHAHQDFLAELGREQEFRQLTYEAFQVRAARYASENPEIHAIIWVDTDGKVEWVAPNDATATFVGDQLAGVRLSALQEALRIRRDVVSPDYREGSRGLPRHHPARPARQRRPGRLHRPAVAGRPVARHAARRVHRPLQPDRGQRRQSRGVQQQFGQADRPPVDRRHQHRIAEQPARPEYRRLPGRRRLAALPAGRADHRADRDRLGNPGPAAPPRPAATEELRAAYAFRQAMSNSLITGLRAIDLDGTITFVNASFAG